VLPKLCALDTQRRGSDKLTLKCRISWVRKRAFFFFYNFAISKTGVRLTLGGFVNILWLNCQEILRQQGQFQSTVELHLSGLNGTTSHPDMQKFRIIGFFIENRLHWQFEVAKISTNVCFRLHIYSRTNRTLIHNSFMYLPTGAKISAIES
jgi:hypothetical protein